MVGAPLSTWVDDVTLEDNIRDKDEAERAKEHKKKSERTHRWVSLSTDVDDSALALDNIEDKDEAEGAKEHKKTSERTHGWASLSTYADDSAVEEKIVRSA
eukprot:gnl/MRDRNA2_/MRDRNA2_19777_c0_seq1.p1 gnl/MRDRNA2_/MRDRNA2_19777_c0~~gnl/MRDRNA2_/MRDRNA2_19777_c0_seq1.p1  ORF type:complete len:101 (-),score=19.06 gnl/MRDRNA2_/MRDRNA2_19777_c0_seq1:4-306(-)